MNSKLTEEDLEKSIKDLVLRQFSHLSLEEIGRVFHNIPIDLKKVWDPKIDISRELGFNIEEIAIEPIEITKKTKCFVGPIHKTEFIYTNGRYSKTTKPEYKKLAKILINKGIKIFTASEHKKIKIFTFNPENLSEEKPTIEWLKKRGYYSIHKEVREMIPQIPKENLGSITLIRINTEHLGIAPGSESMKGIISIASESGLKPCPPSIIYHPEIIRKFIPYPNPHKTLSGEFVEIAMQSICGSCFLALLDEINHCLCFTLMTKRVDEDVYHDLIFSV